MKSQRKTGFKTGKRGSGEEIPAGFSAKAFMAGCRASLKKRGVKKGKFN